MGDTNKQKEPCIEVWKTIASRRQARDSMVWQTGGLVFTGQAFLYSIALGREINPWARLIALGLSVVSAVATMQVMARHRKFEEGDSKWLESFEKTHFTELLHGPNSNTNKNTETVSDQKEVRTQWDAAHRGISKVILNETGLSSESSIKIWMLLQFAFIGVSSALAIYVVFSKLGLSGVLKSFCSC